MKALIFQNKIVEVAAQDFEVAPELFWVDCPDDCTTEWDYNDGICTPPIIVPKTNDELLREFQDAVKSVLDSKAQERQYDSSMSIATYYNSTNSVWKTEAESFVAWRDEVYAYSLSVLSSIQQGGEIPVLDVFIAGIPSMSWPA